MWADASRSRWTALTVLQLPLPPWQAQFNMLSFNKSTVRAMKNYLKAAALAFLLLPCAVFAQQGAESWELQVREFDARYWKAFNDCEVQKLAAMNTDDLEFYHDVGGMSKGVAVFSEDFARNICSRPDAARIRREAVADSLRFYPMRDGAILYGAIVSGEHLFYDVPKDGKEVLTVRAHFTHMLLLQNGEWKVSRVLSFEHGPVRKLTARAEANVPAAQLDLLAGHYVEKDGAFMDIKRDGKHLSLSSGNAVFVLKAGGKDEFFASDRPLTMMFARDRSGKGRTLTVREEGKVVAEAVRR